MRNLQSITVRARPLVVALVLGGAVSSVWATNGYFPHGYGIKAKGMGGASVAMTDNTFAGANNPAISAWAGNRAEIGADIFMPTRSVTRSDGLALQGAAKSDSNTFLVPEFGYNRAVSDRLGMGVTVYGNGGMNTNYPGGQINCGGGGPANLLCGSGELGVDLKQLVIAPTIAYKLDDNHSVGISPLLVYQTFKASGLQAFSPMSSNAASLTNKGSSSSSGIGVRLGYLGKLSDKVSLGASFAPKISMSKFKEYAGLFADGGSFDIPANFAIGASVKATNDVTFAADYQRIKYGGVASIANPSTNQAPLGSAGGPGFGWSDVNVIKLGAEWRTSPALVLRGGINVGDNPVQARDVSFNILAPGVVTTHFTLGGTYEMSKATEVSFFGMYAPSKSVKGASLFNAQTGGMAGNETVSMSQKAIGVQFGWKY